MSGYDQCFRILDLTVGFHCKDSLLASILTTNYSAFRTQDMEADLVFDVHRTSEGSWSVLRDGQLVSQALAGYEDLYSFVYDIEKVITLELQRFRTDLYFIHAAAVERDGKMILLVAESGTGKSTTAWALTTRGLGYMSDELAAIDPHTLDVHPYPHALCLKSTPPEPFSLPEDILRTELTLHVPVSVLPSPVIETPRPIRAIYFLQRKSGVIDPALKPLSAAESGSRLYANTLNALAHPSFGLDAAMHIAASVPAFMLTIGDLQATCDTLLQSLDESQ